VTCGRTRWQGIDLAAADPAIPVAVGGTVTAESVLDAARSGAVLLPAGTRGVAQLNRRKYAPLVDDGRVLVLPGPGDPFACLWWSPQPRAVLRADQARLPRSTRQQVSRHDITTTIDACFAGALAACVAAHWPTWLTPEVQAAYLDLHAEGLARSVEVWRGGELVGGGIGLGFGAACSMDTSFNREPNMAKVGVVDIAVRLGAAGAAEYVDLQFPSPLATAIRAATVDRPAFLAHVRAQDRVPARFDTQRLPARRLG